MDVQVDSRSWLSTLLAPVTVHEFLSKHWLKHHLFLRGSSGRFSTLLSWAELNQLLSHHWRETFRFRLAQQGRDLDPASYADLEGVTPRIRSKDVTDHLRRGATLSFDAIDEIHEPLTRLAEQFEAFFHGGTKINIYGGWRALHGLDLHRDNQEIFILQLSGRKRWLLYGSSIDGVDRGRLASASEPPPGAVLDQIVESGDLLYIPRGCYHVALPMNEPTLHLTLGIKTPRGTDMLQWIADRVKSVAIAGRDLPVLAGSPERLEFAAELRSALVDGLTDDLVAQYLAETGSNFKPRPTFSLPWSATPSLLPDGRDFRIQISGRVQAASNGSGFVLRASGRTMRFPRGMQWVIEQLDEGRETPFGSVLDGVAGRLDEPTARMLVGMLVKENVARIAT